MKIANEWLDYELLLTKDGMKKEKWGEYTLVRPDPQIIWEKKKMFGIIMMDIYHRSNEGGGYLGNTKKKLPEYWTVKI